MEKIGDNLDVNTPRQQPVFVWSLREIAQYIFFSGLAFSVDISIFTLSRLVMEIDLVLANVIARLCGALIAFSFNYYLNFEINGKPRFRDSASRYLSLWLGATIFSSAGIRGLSGFVDNPLLEVCIKTGVELTVIAMNFCVCKFWVYKLK